MTTITLSRFRVATLGEGSQSIRRMALLGLSVILTLMRFGAYWDVQWHATVGRDSFWIPPHDLLYAGVALSGLLGLWFTWRDGLAPRGAAGWPWSWTLVLLGAGAMLSAAPFDELWHRLYGSDVTIWSPPHMVGVVGAIVIGWGMLVGWSVQLRSSDARRQRIGAMIGVLWAATLLVSMTNFGLVPAVRWSVSQPVVVTLYPALGSLTVPLAMLVAAAVTRRWWAPLAIAGGLFALRLLDQPLYNFSTAVVVPLFQQVPRSDGYGIYVHLWFHPLLNLAPALGVTLAAVLWRRAPFRIWHGVVAGTLSGALIWGAVLLLRIGRIIEVFPFRNRGRTALDFMAEARPFLPLLGNSEGLALAWALGFGALGGLVGALIVWRLGAAKPTA